VAGAAGAAQAAHVGRRGLRGGGEPPYDARLYSHTDGYFVARQDLRTKSLGAGDATAAARSAAATAASHKRRGAAALLPGEP
jgi:hypothetical protein